MSTLACQAIAHSFKFIKNTEIIEKCPKMALGGSRAKDNNSEMSLQRYSLYLK